MILLGGSFQRHYSCADSVPAPCAGNYCFMSVRPVIMAGRMWDYELCKCFLRKTCEWKWTRVFHVKMSHFYHAFRCHGRKFWRLKNEIINVSLAFFCLVVVVEDSLVVCPRLALNLWQSTCLCLESYYRQAPLYSVLWSFLHVSSIGLFWYFMWWSRYQESIAVEEETPVGCYRGHTPGSGKPHATRGNWF